MKWFITGFVVGAATAYIALGIWVRAILVSAVRSARRTLRLTHIPRPSASEVVAPNDDDEA